MNRPRRPPRRVPDGLLLFAMCLGGLGTAWAISEGMWGQAAVQLANTAYLAVFLKDRAAP